MIQNIIQKVDSLLKSAKFETIALSDQHKYCYDILAKRENIILLLKIFPNIDNLNQAAINGIKTLSSLLGSKPLLIGIKNRYHSLEDDTIYVREDLPFISMNTLEKVLKFQQFPHILAKRGGGVIFLDGNLMKIKREQKNISRKILSEDLNIAKRTLCSYENETMRPSQVVAEKIIKILEDGDKEIFRKINVLEWKVKFSVDKDLIFEGELSPFEEHLKEVFDDIGISSYWYQKGQVPFKVTLYSNSENIKGENPVYPLFSEVTDDQNKLKEFHVKTLSMFTQLFQKFGICIINNDVKIPSRFKTDTKVPIITLKNLEKVDDEKDFIDLIKEKNA